MELGEIYINDMYYIYIYILYIQIYINVCILFIRILPVVIFVKLTRTVKILILRSNDVDTVMARVLMSTVFTGYVFNERPNTGPDMSGIWRIIKSRVFHK